MPASKAATEHAAERAAKIYTVLKQCAENNLPAPDNATLAERFGVSKQVILNSLNFLVANGMIEVAGSGFARRVTIAATGKTTPARGRTKPLRFPSDTARRARR